MLIFVGVIGGLIAFGMVGIFVGPVVLAVTYELLVVWVEDGRRIAGRRGCRGWARADSGCATWGISSARLTSVRRFEAIAGRDVAGSRRV